MSEALIGQPLTHDMEITSKNQINIFVHATVLLMKQQKNDALNVLNPISYISNIISCVTHLFTPFTTDK